MLDFKTFVLGQAVSQELLKNEDAKKLFEFLSTPKSVASMISFSHKGLPAISGIVNSMEKEFATAENFPLAKDRNRQVVGIMVRYILEHFGYSPIRNATSSEKRLRNFSNAKLFKTSAVYEKTHQPKLKLEMAIVPVDEEKDEK